MAWFAVRYRSNRMTPALTSWIESAIPARLAYFDARLAAGYGWQVGTRRKCRSTSIEITRIGLDDTGHPDELIFKWWTRSTLDHIYRYVPDYGMTHA